MIGLRVDPICHELCRRLGQFLTMIPLHRLEFFTSDGVVVVRKRRARFANWFIAPGNRFLYLTGSPVVVLPTSQWLKWELAVDQSTGANVILSQSTDPATATRSLLSRRLSGVTLESILTDSRSSDQRKLDAVCWSLIALRRLHQTRADWGNGTWQSISHGDATVNNVIVDFDNGSAYWIDFDMRHQPDVLERDRQTDDLHSLIYSAAAHLSTSRFREVAAILVNSGIDNALLEHFRSRLEKEWIHLSPFQLAQAPLRWSVAMALRQQLLQCLAIE